MHRFHVYQPRDYYTSAIVPYSLSFETIHEFNAAILYWGARLSVINLCTLLFPLKQDDGKRQNSSLSAHYGSLRSRKRRTVFNIMMYWEFRHENGLTLGSPAKTQAALAVWCALGSTVALTAMSIIRLRSG